MDNIWSGEPGLVLDGKYRTDALLGQGGMGAVDRATHLGTTRTVALKVIHPRFSQDPEFVERFRREAEAADSGLMTRAGSVTGTPLSMSPEQCRGKQVDTRSDIYSLGIVAYRMLAGAPPFSGDALQLIKLHCETPPPNLAERGRRLPRRLSALVMTALAKNPADRPDSAAGFGSALRASAEGSGALLRHAVSLYSEHFPVFFKLSLLASLRLIFFAGLVVAIDRDNGGATSSPAAILIFLSMIAANLFAYAAVAGGSVPLVVQLTAAPLREVQIRTALNALKRRGVLFTASTLLLVMTLAASVLLILSGIALAFWHILYAPVEHLSFTGTLTRARRLLRRVWPTAVIIALLQFALPLLVWILSIDSHFVLRFDDNWRPREAGFTFGLSSGSMLFQLLNIVVTPLTAIMTAQLYLKARHAGGETIDTP